MTQPPLRAKTPTPSPANAFLKHAVDEHAYSEIKLELETLSKLSKKRDSYLCLESPNTRVRISNVNERRRLTISVLIRPKRKNIF